ncbi:hypothetical protein APHAL10511_007988 [Amanita phalloides]|nr:hypothetical protein APHAL10511_007988 [Amanita phalloides]
MLQVFVASFRSLSLFLLAFSPLDRSLVLVSHIPAFGPHQYIAASHDRRRVYTTTWGNPPTLHSWVVDGDATSVSLINSTPITSTSSYIAIPAPYTHIYSTGGPTGEVHLIDPVSGGFSDKIQEFLFVSKDELPLADKSRLALRYGSHGIEFSSRFDLAFVPVLGTNSIEIYEHNTSTGLLTHLSSSPSPRGPSAHDGPRHVKIHPNGRVLYCVTEHSNYVDAYTIASSPPHLTYHSSHSLVPPSLRDQSFRGDTLFVSPSTRALFTTTRGATSRTRGWLSVFALDEGGLFLEDDPKFVERFETPTSGGKANAIDVLSKSTSVSTNSSYLIPGAHHMDLMLQSPHANTGQDESVWILLTDDDDYAVDNGGGLRVLEWDGWSAGGFKEVAAWPQDEKELLPGGSHAIWL